MPLYENLKTSFKNSSDTARDYFGDREDFELLSDGVKYLYKKMLLPVAVGEEMSINDLDTHKFRTEDVSDLHQYFYDNSKSFFATEIILESIYTAARVLEPIQLKSNFV